MSEGLLFKRLREIEESQQRKSTYHGQYEYEILDCAKVKKWLEEIMVDFPKCDECEHWTAYHPERGEPKSCESVLYGHSRVGCPKALKWFSRWLGPISAETTAAEET